METQDKLIIGIIAGIVLIGGGVYLYGAGMLPGAGSMSATEMAGMNEDSVAEMPSDAVVDAQPEGLPSGDQEAGAEADPAADSISIETEPERTLEDRIKENENTVEVILNDVSGGNSEGTAYILREDGEIFHTVTARLPDLEQGEFYEGWLVDQFPRVAFFSTGKMEQLRDGRYFLSFNGEEEYPDFTQVVITIEQVDDQQPERHVLEGNE